MKLVFMLFICITLSVGVMSCSEQENSAAIEKQKTLMDRIHVQMELVGKEMEQIKNTSDPIKRKQLLDAHRPNMDQLLAMYRQLQKDASEGASGGQSAAMADLMVAQIRLYESIMATLEAHSN